MAHVVPERFVVTETELWPNLLDALLARGVPCSAVNGRISDYTIRWYTLLKPLFGPLVGRFTTVCVSSPEQADRFRAIGVPPERVIVTGHTKYDTSPSVETEEERRALRKAYFPEASESAPIIVLGSVRPSEENGWLSACVEQWQAGSELKVIVAPRHAEKFEHFARVLSGTGRQWARWSDPDSVRAGNHDVLLLDTMGRLEGAYSIAALAFVGATLVDIGGHNPLEPAMYGVPVCVGPFVKNINEIVAEMLGRRGILSVNSSTAIRSTVSRVAHADPVLRQVGAEGRLVWERHRGATGRVITALLEGAS
jgi:3-deoxy-D-manno-octulosonic-acid transferase